MVVLVAEDSFWLGSTSNSLDQDDQEDPDDAGKQFNLEPPPPKVTQFQDAISSLEEVQSFLDRRGMSKEAARVTSSINKLTYHHCQSVNSARKTTLEEYFLHTAVFVLS